MVITYAKKIVLSVFILAVASGCRTMQTRSAAPAPERGTGPISSMAVFWSEAVLRQNNMPVAQGFAGKLYLFGGSKTAITAPGKFTIYAYDETAAAKDPEKAAHVKPDFTWELSDSDLKNLVKKDAIGWSYSFWLPCGPPAATERRYSILVRFTPDNAPPVMSDSTLVTLPAVGTARNTALAQTQIEKLQKVMATGEESGIKVAEAP